MSEIVNILPYSIDLKKSLEKTELHTLFVMGDNEAHRFEVEILRGSEKPDLTGTVTGYFTNFKEDTTVTVPGKVEAGKAVVVLSKPCYKLHGQFVLTIQVKIGEVETSIFMGEGYMRSSKGETIIYDDYIVYDVNTLLAQISAMKTATDNANQAAAAANAAAGNADAKAQAAQTAAAAANAAAGNADAKAQAAQTAAAAANAAKANWDASHAADSAKLGGKPPEYYLQPKNLLGNSDFLIAQAGYGGMHGATRYVCDRWYNLYGFGEFSFDKSNGLTMTYKDNHTYACQKIENDDLYVGKPLTFSVRLSDGSIHVCSGVYTKTTATAIKDLGTYIIGIYEGEVRIITYEGSVTIKWAALYEGAYTAETLPPYVSKENEIVSCLEHYREYGDDGIYAYCYTNDYLSGFAFDIPMRVAPDIVECSILRLNGFVNMTMGDSSVTTVRGVCYIHCPGAVAGEWYRITTLKLSANLGEG